MKMTLTIDKVTLGVAFRMTDIGASVYRFQSGAQLLRLVRNA